TSSSTEAFTSGLSRQSSFCDCSSLPVGVTGDCPNSTSQTSEIRSATRLSATIRNPERPSTEDLHAWYLSYRGAFHGGWILEIFPRVSLGGFSSSSSHWFCSSKAMKCSRQ